MLVNLRNAMMAGRELPYGLRRVAYIQTTNNTPSSYTFINTGITPTRNMKWEIRASLQRKTAYSALMGFFGGSYGRFDIGRNVNDKWQFNRGLTAISDVPSDSGWHILKLDGRSNTGYVDGSPVVTLSSSFQIDITGTIVLFCRGRGDKTPPIDITGSDSVFVNMSLDYSKIWNANGDLIQHLIAVRDGTVGCMFDLVTGQIFRKQGNGSAFVIGPDKVSSAGGGYKRKCVRRSHRRSARPSARFCARFTPHLWKEVA